MKNKLLLILTILVSIVTINVVKAEEEGPFYLDWDTKKENYAYETLPYKDGYLTVTYKYTNSNEYEYLRYYDYQGNLKAEREFEINVENSYGIYGLTTDGENIYTIASKYILEQTGSNAYSSIFTYYIWKLDEELNTISSLEMPSDFYMYWSNEYGNMRSMKIDGNKLYILGDDIYVINTDLSSYQVKNATEALVKKYFPDLYYADALYDYLGTEQNPIMSVIVSTKDNNIALAYNQYDMVCHEEVGGASIPVEPPSSPEPTRRGLTDTKSSSQKYGEHSGITYYQECTSFILALYNTEGDEAWSKTMDGYYSAFDIKIVGDYIIVAVDGEETNPILIYDMEGNLVQTIESKNYYTSYAFISGTDDSFITSNICSAGTYGASSGGGGSYRMESGPSCSERHQVYSLTHLIEAKVEGKGEVKVISSAKTHSSVTFEVIPDEGYVLSSIKVTDAAGNIINVNDYTFTMPSADVTIEAVFVLNEVAPAINPETSDIALVLILAATIFSIICVIRSYKRLIFLK